MEVKTRLQCQIGDWSLAAKSGAILKESSFAYIADGSFVDSLRDSLSDVLGESSDQEKNKKLIHSYYSYVLQVAKNIDRMISEIKNGVFDKDLFLLEIVRSSIANAKPWYYTYLFISEAFINIDMDIVFKSSDDDVRNYILRVIAEGFESESIYSIEKYEKVSHIILDVAFDSGWHKAYANTKAIKKIEGLVRSVERSSVLREVCIQMAQVACVNMYYDAARQFLILGFPDIPKTIFSLNKSEMIELLSLRIREVSSRILKSELGIFESGASLAQIANGALRVAGSDL